MRIRVIIFISIFICSPCLSFFYFQRDVIHASNDPSFIHRNRQQSINLQAFVPEDETKTEIFDFDNEINIDQENMNELDEHIEDDLIENWDFHESNLPLDILQTVLNANQPEHIVYYDSETPQNFYPQNYTSRAKQSDKTLYLMSEEFAKKIVQEKQLMNSSYTDYDMEDDFNEHNDQHKNPDKFHLWYDAYDINFFSPGTRHDGSILVPVTNDYRMALNGPDYAFDNFSPTDDAQVIRHLSTILPLGHNGLLVLQVNNGGSIFASGGIDFVVYQTTFRISGTNTLWQKFAYLGVSNELNIQSVRWFPCNPSQGEFWGCVGLLPTEDGGDVFRLSDIGVSYAKYIWIKDIGTNFSMPSKWPTDGCAIDAVHLSSAYVLTP